MWRQVLIYFRTHSYHADNYQAKETLQSEDEEDIKAAKWIFKPPRPAGPLAPVSALLSGPFPRPQLPARPPRPRFVSAPGPDAPGLCFGPAALAALLAGSAAPARCPLAALLRGRWAEPPPRRLPPPRRRCPASHGAAQPPGAPMGSERTEMRKRQMSTTQETPGAAQAQHSTGNRGSNACCFCWCCCCSCSCLTVRNQDEERARRTSHELQAESIPNCEESPAPTLEEVNAWAQSFDKLMLTPAGRNAFREFLRTEFSEENMLFWMACEELKQESNKSVIEEKARLIYEDYISILSPKEVSLDSRVREVINRNMLEPSQHTFDDAQLQIYTLMHRDSYPRFMNSAIYKDLLRSLSEKSIEA
ncbi:regulator of G-protein signaling 20 isoform X1 [Phaenicophaeus curvirostris]